MDKETSSASDEATGENRPVSMVTKPASSIPGKASVRTALDEMHARGVDTSPVTAQGGELLGTVSQDQMNRKVGGRGHDPKSESVETQVGKADASCFEDQTIAEAEQIMLDGKILEVPIVTRAKVLVGTAKLTAIAMERAAKKQD